MQEQLLLLNQISDELNKDLDLDNMLQRVIDLTVTHFKASSGSIMLFDDNRRVSKYILQRQHGNISDDQASRILGQVLSEGFAGWVLEHARGDVIFDTRGDKRWYNYPNQPYTTRSVIASPLSRRSRILGLVTITHQDPHHFHEEDLPLLNAIAGQAAIALENAQLFYQTELERTKLSAIINSTQDAIVVTHPENHKVLLMNPAAEKLFRIKRGSWYDRLFEEVSSLNSVIDIINLKPESEQEFKLPDGRILLPSVIDVPNVGRLALMHDISALKALDKLRSEFVVAFTHDLAAPLAAIKGYIELMKLDGSLSEQQVEDLEAIRMSVDQMRTLIKDLQELTRLETLKNMLTCDIKLKDTLQKSCQAFQPMAEVKKIHLSLDAHLDDIVTHGNPALISRAVDNLIENAIKYTESEGHVSVGLSTNDQEALITVKDTGPGIPSQKLPNIFEKFFRAHAPGENEVPGSGLGLSIVKTIVERHNGRIWVESEVNVGSTFTIALPLQINGSSI
jgi:two-component system phosphate regulon sensor histidine kinase PhoR